MYLKMKLMFYIPSHCEDVRTQTNPLFGWKLKPYLLNLSEEPYIAPHNRIPPIESLSTLDTIQNGSYLAKSRYIYSRRQQQQKRERLIGVRSYPAVTRVTVFW